MEQVLRKMTLDFFGKGKHKVSPDELLRMEDVYLLDVRSREEAETLFFRMGCHPNIECKNIPVNEIPDRVNEIPKGKFIAVFCSGGARSTMVYVYLASKGFDPVRIIIGGYNALTEAIKPGKILKSISAGKQE